MTEEEKKAIEYLENRLEILHNNTQWSTENSIKVVLNLIDKQQNEIASKEKQIKLMQSCDLAKVIKQQEKEIEELKRDYEIITDDMKNHNVVYTDMPEFEERYISKDIIKERLKKLKEKEQELSDEQGYFGSSELQAKIEELEQLLEG